MATGTVKWFSDEKGFGFITPDEPQIAKAAALAYDLPEEPSRDELAKLAETWRPFRSWVQMLLRMALAERRVDRAE